MMNVKPILFSGDMIRAILDGRKTQTRRVVKPQPTPWLKNGWQWDGHRPNSQHGVCASSDGNMIFMIWSCPYGQPGDLLWVRETWQYYDWTDDGIPKIRYAADNAAQWCDYPEDQEDKVNDIWATLSESSNYSIDNRARDRKWRPSIYLPRWASRVTLKITDVRVQRIQEISDADALSEGIEAKGFESAHEYKFCLFHSQELFVDLWDSINGTRGFGWHVNPWVWALTFEVIRENVDAVLSKAA